MDALGVLEPDFEQEVQGTPPALSAGQLQVSSEDLFDLEADGQDGIE